MPKPPPEPLPRLFINEWMDALQLEPKIVAEKAQIGVSYLSQLGSLHKQKKPKSPSFSVIWRIAQAMELRVNDLLGPPPPRHMIEEIHKLPPDLIDRLRR